MRYLATVAALASLVQLVASSSWIPSSRQQHRKRQNDATSPDNFVTAKNGRLELNGKPFHFLATDAYWLMNISDDDLETTFRNISLHNISVVRTWGFNDVLEIPTVGSWFQLLDPNGTVAINDGPSGFGRLDKIFDAAERNNLMVQISLTNNWNPASTDPNNTATSVLGRRAAANTSTPRGFLSNDYGGMDAYVRSKNLTEHDQFFTNQTLIDAFKNYLTALVPRFANKTRLVAWEVANDARCNSTLPTSSSCNTQTVTLWHSIIAKHIKTLDPNHLVSSGCAGFFCPTCAKIFAVPPPPPPPPVHPVAPPPPPAPVVSPAPGAIGPRTAKGALAQKRNQLKRDGEVAKQRRESAAEKRARGEAGVKWKYRGLDDADSLAKRQALSFGPAYDGSHGVDSQDIMSIPEMGFSTFQLFPDQENYGPSDPSLASLNNTIDIGVSWIQQQAALAQSLDKPSIATGFGVVTQNNLPFFVPFNDSQPLVTLNPTLEQSQTPIPDAVGVEQGQLPFTDQEQLVIYSQWIQAAIQAGVSGITQYQWGQANLTEPPTQNQIALPSTDTNTFIPSLGQQGMSPNDGYQGIVSSLQDLLQTSALQQNQVAL